MGTGGRSSRQNQGSFWTTIPGILKELAAVLTALGAVLVALHQIGVFDKGPAEASGPVLAGEDGSTADPAPVGPSSPEAACKERTAHVRAIPLATTSANAHIAAGDDEIDSDDWTSVLISSRIAVASDGRTVELYLTWYAQERNRDRSYGDTRFISSRTIILVEVERACPGSKIVSIDGISASAEREEFYRGEVHGFVPFPDFGSLRDIRVQFDGKGRRDNERQALEATLAEFSVKLSASNV